MKAAKCVCQQKHITYHIYVKRDRNTVEYVKQSNRWPTTDTNYWSSSLEEAISLKLVDVLEALLNMQEMLPYLKQVKELKLNPWGLPSSLGYDSALTMIKEYEKELRLLLETKPTKWKD